LTVAVPLFPSLVAVIVTGPPTATPVTRPLADTLAIAELLDDHTTARPVITLPSLSSVDAVSWVVVPIVIDGDAGLTVTDATDAGGTGMTVTDADPLFPSLVAVIVTGPPTATPVTRPAEETLAIAVLLEVHVTARPVRALPDASRVEAES
jgi:hypothetical protein